MNPLAPESPFSQRYQLLARFTSGETRSDPVQVAFEYSTVVPGEISGVVVGDRSAQRAIAAALEHGTYTSLASEPVLLPENAQWSVQADRIVFESMVGIDTRTEGLFRRAADLYVGSLTVDETRPEGWHTERSVEFFLYGPPNVWNLIPDLDRSSKGDIHYANADLGLEVDRLRAELDIVPFQEASSADRALRLKRSVVVLRIKTNASTNDLRDDDFLTSARALADDVLLLTSLASKTWADWFRYTLRSERRTLRFVRSTAREPETDFRHHDRMIVAPAHLREFLQTALPRFRKTNRDLRVAILTHIAAKDERYQAPQFLTRFTVLEALRARFAEQRGHTSILPKSKAKKLRAGVRKVLPGLEIDAETTKAVEAKLPELDRPSFAVVLDLLLADLDMALADLYPPEVVPTLVKTRNRLVHGEVGLEESPVFSIDLYRLNVLLDRLLLRLLGWDDLSYAPSTHDLDWIRRPTP